MMKRDGCVLGKIQLKSATYKAINFRDNQNKC